MLINGNAARIPLADGVVQCVVTSPPYWGLRQYLEDGHKYKVYEIGLEPTPELYVEHLVSVFREVRRVLRDDGVAWANLGDSYSAGGGTQVLQSKNASHGLAGYRHPTPNLAPKQLVGIPWRVAFALQADGWWLRSDVIWHKPNCMPESVRDRPTKAHEYVFLLTKAARYFYDAEAIKEASADNSGGGQPTASRKTLASGQSGRQIYERNTGRNKRSVWTIPAQSYKGAHFATFPEKLVEPCILAGTSARGECPECGRGWVRVVETPQYPKELRARPGDDGVKVGYGHKQVNTTGTGQVMQDWRNANPPTTTGWTPQCKCGHAPQWSEFTMYGGVRGEYRFCTVCTDDKPPVGDATRWYTDEPEPTHCAHVPIPQIVLDPFVGTATVGRVAAHHRRRFVGLDLNPDYIELAKERTRNLAVRLAL